MVAYHYPPCFGSSGIHRTLSFSRDLPAHGWRSMVLTVHPRAYAAIDASRLTEVPEATVVARAFALDALRHLAVRRHTVKLAVLPDRWATWWLGAVPAGLRLVRQHRPAALWSTAPVATAHLVAMTVAGLTGLPWVADFRDPMTSDDYPADPLARRVCQWIEERTVARAARLVFTTAATRDAYMKRYRLIPPERFRVIPNGYDERDFARLQPPPDAARKGRPLRLLHAGTVYEESRNPGAFLAALGRLKADGRVSAATLRVELRGSGADELCRNLATRHGVDDIVRVLPALPYREMLENAAGADALLLLQDASCNAQVPAKVYEYLRLGKPILGLTPREGDTAAILEDVGGATLVDLDDEAAIAARLPRFLAAVHDDSHPRPDRARALRYARHLQAGPLAECLGQAADTMGVPSR